MKKFLCYDTNDAASGKINVGVNGVLKPNSTVPSSSGEPYKSLVTDGDGNVKWEDRLAYDDSRVVVDYGDGELLAKVSDEVPSWVSVIRSIKVWYDDDVGVIPDAAPLRDFGDGNFGLDGVFFITTDNYEHNGLVFPEKGVYFFFVPDGTYITGIASADSDTPEITWDGNIEFTKTIDPKYIPADHINSLIDAKLGVIENGSY